jgi:hypothetical protein
MMPDPRDPRADDGRRVDAAVEHDGELLADARARELVEAPSALARQPEADDGLAALAGFEMRRFERRTGHLRLRADDVRGAVTIRQQRGARRQERLRARRRLAALERLALGEDRSQGFRRGRRIVHEPELEQRGLADQFLRLRRVGDARQLQHDVDLRRARLRDAELVGAVPDHLDRLVDRLGDRHVGRQLIRLHLHDEMGPAPEGRAPC